MFAMRLSGTHRGGEPVAKDTTAATVVVVVGLGTSKGVEEAKRLRMLLL